MVNIILNEIKMGQKLIPRTIAAMYKQWIQNNTRQHENFMGKSGHI